MEKELYPSDLTDPQWRIVDPLLPKPRCPWGPGRPRETCYRDILNAVFYLLRTGCQWRMLPRDYPNWKVVYHYFRLWRLNGVWGSIHDALREMVRIKEGRDPTPSAAIIDSQSVKTTQKCGPRGFDAGKKVNGRKRQNAILLLTRLASFWLLLFMWPAFKTEMVRSSHACNCSANFLE